MKKMTICEIKEIELNILIKIDSICKSNHIEYSLCGGTLLGAVRHKGFIPWDDDIDITMTRANYEKFIDYMKNNIVENIHLVDYDTKNYGYMFAKVCDSRTKLIEHHNKPVKDLGVFVDVFPVDYLGNSEKDSRKILSKFRFNKYLLTSWNWKSFYFNKAKTKRRQLIRFLFFVMSRFARKDAIIKSMNKIINSLNEKKRFSGCLFGSYDSKDILESDMFDELINIEFEGHSFLCFKYFDKYLKSLYGNYMAVPPLEKQVSHHTFDAYFC